MMKQVHWLSTPMSKLDEILEYFMHVVTEPVSVPPWSEWWAANLAAIETVFSLHDFVRLKYRSVLGAQQILQRMGRLPEDYVSPVKHLSGTCLVCGKRTVIPEVAGPNVFCANCNVMCSPD
jgi:hypothetical protein